MGKGKERRECCDVLMEVEHMQTARLLCVFSQLND
jgi:hypothetical protein